MDEGLMIFERRIAYEMSHRRFAPNSPPAPPEPAKCSRYERCKDCPYPSHGFICWHSETSCLRTEAEKPKAKERKHERSNQQ